MTINFKEQQCRGFWNMCLCYSCKHLKKLTSEKKNVRLTKFI